MPHRLVVPALALMCLAACGDDTDDAAAIGVKSLTSSECNKDADAKVARCVKSQRDGKTLALQVYGVESSCLGNDLLKDVPWRGTAKEESGRVVVSVDWPLDKTPACGSCVYDFKVELGPYDWPDRTDVKFEVRSCPSCNVDDSRSITLSTKDDETSVHDCGEDSDAGVP